MQWITDIIEQDDDGDTSLDVIMRDLLDEGPRQLEEQLLGSYDGEGSTWYSDFLDLYESVARKTWIFASFEAFETYVGKEMERQVADIVTDIYDQNEHLLS